MKHSRFLSALTILAMLVVALSTYTPAFAASATIDFEGLAEGSTVSSVSSGNGISGDAIAGTVTVLGVNPQRPFPNAAMIFDGTCQPGGTPADCTGDDADLFFPAHGNILIITLDNDSTDPDDADFFGQYFDFDFSNFGPGEVTVESLDVMDVEFSEGEDDGSIQLFSGGFGGTLLGNVPLPNTGNNGETTVAINTAGVDFMRVTLNGSGAIDNIRISTEEEPPAGDQGCTPGYWKNHLDSWAATGFSPSDTVEDVFDVPDSFGLDDATLLEALDFVGGPGTLGSARLLLHHAVAAVLNAAHPDVAYPMTVADIISAVNTALLGDRDGMLALKDILDANNNLGCPLN